MKSLVLNCGSSSIKYQLFDTEQKKVLTKGLVDKIGLDGASIKNVRGDGDTIQLAGEILDHQVAIEYLLGILVSRKHGSLKSLDELDAVGHRVVHGAEKFKASVLITDEVVKQIEECIELAPLHNPPNLKGIYAIKAVLPNVPQVAVFDTAFHQTMEPYAFMYALPYSLYERHKIRRYGFHGTSHKYVSARACEFLGLQRDNSKVITCHLGNGSSIAAVANGQTVDTSMGMTPVEGLIMGTRCGDLDAGVLTYIMSTEEIGIATANTLINKFSGVLGISGVSSDMREVEEAANKKNNARAKLALEMFCYRIKKYIGSYAAAMGGVDAVVFTGGIGENSVTMRAGICNGLDFLGLEFDSKKNETVRGEESLISKPTARVKAVVIPTNEELVIALDTVEIMKKQALLTYEVERLDPVKN
jgi:acetate kinase